MLFFCCRQSLIFPPLNLSLNTFQAEEKMSEGADQDQEIQEGNHRKEGQDENYEEEEEEEEEGGAGAAKAHRRGEM